MLNVIDSMANKINLFKRVNNDQVHSMCGCHVSCLYCMGLGKGHSRNFVEWVSRTTVTIRANSEICERGAYSSSRSLKQRIVEGCSPPEAVGLLYF